MKQEIRVSVGRRIRNYREDLGLTREAFAEQVGISPQFLSEIEHAKKEFPWKHCIRFVQPFKYVRIIFYLECLI